MEVIADLEAGGRGWYCGALGVIRPGGTATFNVAIRTVELAARHLTCGIGSGIVADSEPGVEVAEWRREDPVPRRHGHCGPWRPCWRRDGRIPRLEAHLARLAAACADLGLRSTLPR